MEKDKRRAWATETLGHEFSRIDLLQEALTHPSIHHRASYQRLEFLGDRVLGLIVADLLLRTYPDEAEGVIARRFVKLVRKETLADVARDLDVPAFIELDAAARQSGVNHQDGLCADVMEALIGAIFSDAGLEVARAFVELHWRAKLKQLGARKDAKTRLQEWAQARGLPLPNYETVRRTGPAHSPQFVIHVEIKGYPPTQGEAGSKREAEMAAARAMLKTLSPESKG